MARQRSHAPGLDTENVPSMPAQQPSPQQVEYAEYLATPEWAERRAAAVERAGHRCQLCNSPERLNVHHRTYERVRNEDPNDLTVLCRKCHEDFHGISATTQTKRYAATPKKKRQPRTTTPAKGRSKAAWDAAARAIAQMHPGRMYTTKQIAALGGTSPSRIGPVLAAMAQRKQLQQLKSKQWALIGEYVAPRSAPKQRKVDKLAKQNAQLHELQVENRKRQEAQARAREEAAGPGEVRHLDTAQRRLAAPPQPTPKPNPEDVEKYGGYLAKRGAA